MRAPRVALLSGLSLMTARWQGLALACVRKWVALLRGRRAASRLHDAHGVPCSALATQKSMVVCQSRVCGRDVDEQRGGGVMASVERRRVVALHAFWNEAAHVLGVQAERCPNGANPGSKSPNLVRLRAEFGRTWADPGSKSVEAISNLTKVRLRTRPMPTTFGPESAKSDQSWADVNQCRPNLAGQ